LIVTGRSAPRLPEVRWVEILIQTGRLDLAIGGRGRGRIGYDLGAVPHLAVFPPERLRTMSVDGRLVLERRLHDLQVEHRDLDEVVSRLAATSDTDELLIKRLKKRKLQLKDQIERLRSLLIPDLDA